MIHSVTLKEWQHRVLPNIQPRLERALIGAMRRSAHEGVRFVVQEIDAADAVDTGGLRQSAGSRTLPKGAELSVDAPYAAAVEYGTRPHRPPIEPLAEWAMRKGIASTESEARGIAFAIASKIAKEGTKPTFFFRKAMTRLDPVVKREIRRALTANAKRGG